MAVSGGRTVTANVCAPISSNGVPSAEPNFDRGSLYTLALGAFAVGTEGFMIAAILPSIAQSLDTSIQAAGQLVTVFAITYAVSSPLLTALTAHWPRRRLLIVSLAGFVVANLIAAMAPGYWSLAAARVLLAITAGLYVPNANATAGILAPPAFRGRALAIINGGLSVAVILGVPAGAFVGTHLGWRMTFVAVAVLSAIALLVLIVRLPREIDAGAPAGLAARLAVVRMPGVLPILATTTIWTTGAISVYTYASPFLTYATGLSSDRVGLILMLWGVSAMTGVMLGGYASDRLGARRAVGIALPVLAASFMGLTTVALLWGPHALPFVLPLVVTWGLGAWGFFPPHQARLVNVVGLLHTPVALSLNASFMYLGFALAAILGSIVISVASVAWIGLSGAICVICAIAMSSYAWRHQPADATASEQAHTTKR
jgi:predicted MFS family arabinose efflux permease